MKEGGKKGKTVNNHTKNTKQEEKKRIEKREKKQQSKKNRKKLFGVLNGVPTQTRTEKTTMVLVFGCEDCSTSVKVQTKKGKRWMKKKKKVKKKKVGKQEHTREERGLSRGQSWGAQSRA